MCLSRDGPLPLREPPVRRWWRRVLSSCSEEVTVPRSRAMAAWQGAQRITQARTDRDPVAPVAAMDRSERQRSHHLAN
jgi:hypothetical protein